MICQLLVIADASIGNTWSNVTKSRWEPLMRLNSENVDLYLFVF